MQFTQNYQNQSVLLLAKVGAFFETQCIPIIVSRTKWAHWRKNVVDADDAVRSRRAAVVYDRRVTLNPDPAAALRQEPIVFRRRLAFQ